MVCKCIGCPFFGLLTTHVCDHTGGAIPQTHSAVGMRPHTTPLPHISNVRSSINHGVGETQGRAASNRLPRRQVHELAVIGIPSLPLQPDGNKGEASALEQSGNVPQHPVLLQVDFLDPTRLENGLPRYTLPHHQHIQPNLGPAQAPDGYQFTHQVDGQEIPSYPLAQPSSDQQPVYFQGPPMMLAPMPNQEAEQRPPKRKRCRRTLRDRPMLHTLMQLPPDFHPNPKYGFNIPPENIPTSMRNETGHPVPEPGKPFLPSGHFFPLPPPQMVPPFQRPFFDVPLPPPELNADFYFYHQAPCLSGDDRGIPINELVGEHKVYGPFPAERMMAAGMQHSPYNSSPPSRSVPEAQPTVEGGGEDTKIVDPSLPPPQCSPPPPQPNAEDQMAMGRDIFWNSENPPPTPPGTINPKDLFDPPLESLFAKELETMPASGDQELGRNFNLELLFSTEGLENMSTLGDQEIGLDFNLESLFSTEELETMRALGNQEGEFSLDGLGQDTGFDVSGGA
ncbi:hypothetical protein CC78DRAFT_588197 [Lojkania enalia]|uniref:Uncharacterized protein n=1 Tax=Lojkania enalia TaxID=147567 RepID=A0A9P4JZ61_9PLEO|nr:hypothetical protein CC78DRAFT_588197 [Didymosphaeria enalia]